jgi:uncharacterized protein
METITITHILAFLGIGVFSGLAAGLMGVGGGLINVPGLYYVFVALGYPQQHCFHMALGTSLAIIVFTSTSAARTHYVKGNFIPRVMLIAGIAGIAGAFGSSILALNLSDTVLKKAFAVVLYLAAVRIFTKKPPAEGVNDEMRLEVWRLAIIGLGSGLLAGLFGIGGGLVGVPLFMLWAKISPHQSVGSSSGMVVILALFGAIGYATGHIPVENPLPGFVGYINLIAWISVAASSILTARVGATLAAKSSPRTLSIIFACGLVIVATKMLFL